MSNITPFEGAGVPAHIASMFGGVDANNDLSHGVSASSYPILSYKGKVWHIVQGDTRTLLTNPDGEPRSSIEVVIVKSNPNLSKIYYQGGYEEGSSAKPTCYSNDGKEPARDATSPQAPSCQACPHNAWGSRITEQGGKGKACTDLRRIAVAPSGDLSTLMLLRIPAGSLKDLTAYADMLNKRKAPYAAVVTRIGFDHTVAHQKFKFTPVRWLEQQELEQVSATMNEKKDIINRITGVEADIVVPAVAHQPKEDDGWDAMGAAPAYVAPPAPAPQPAAAPAPAPVQQAAPARKPVETIISEANDSIDDVLGMLDD